MYNLNNICLLNKLKIKQNDGKQINALIKMDKKGALKPLAFG